MNKMKQWFSITLLLAFNLALFSCIRSEEQNAEADIVACQLPEDVLVTQPIIQNNAITLYLRDNVDLQNLNIKYVLSNGATIEPADTANHDYSVTRNITVTSQNKQWSKTYSIEIRKYDKIEDLHFDNFRYFANSAGTNKYEIIYENTFQNKTLDWSSGNQGFMISNSNAAPKDYPTFIDDNGYSGKCATLVTRSTGTWGRQFRTPIASGSLFLGVFQLTLGNTSRSTHFGVPCYLEPTTFSGYFKYKAGEQFTNREMQVVPNQKDNFTIYAVLFERSADVPFLDGTNSRTSNAIVKIADVTNKIETNEWTRFEVPFNFVGNKTIDQEKLKNGNYSIAIILSSSEDGANFNGAIGSTLQVDEFHITYKE